MNKVPEMFIDTRPQQAPVFTTHLQNQHQLQEAQHVHLEAQVEPRADPNLKIEWFKNGEPLSLGSRIRSTFDFGLVTLSVNSLRADDSAIYTCKATNLLGEAVSTCTLKIEGKAEDILIKNQWFRIIIAQISVRKTISLHFQNINVILKFLIS